MKKRIISAFLAFIMVFAMVVPLVRADEDVAKQKTNLIVHKILMDSGAFKTHDIKKTYDPSKGIPEEDFKAFFSNDSKEISGVAFNIYKADENKGNIIQELRGKTVDGDNLTNKKLIEVTPKDNNLTKENGLEIKGLEEGTYYIFEDHANSTYKSGNGETLTDMKAIPTKITLPLLDEKGYRKNVHIYPKNIEEKPTTDKDFSNKIGQEGREEAKKNPEGKAVGDKVFYTVKTEVPSKSKWKTAFWDDKMTEGLTLSGNLKDYKITYAGNDNILLDEKDYELKIDDNKRGFTLELNDNGIKKINDKENKGTITITYSAIINGEAVAEVPESNDVTFHYGNNSGHGNTPVPTKPKNKEITVIKNWDSKTYDLEDPTEVTYTLYNAQTGEKVRDEKKVNYSKQNQNPEVKWSDLDDNIEYIVKETYVKGYAANYTAEDGTIKIDNKKNNNPEPIDPTEPRVVIYGKKFVKTKKSDENTRLGGAKFVLKSSEGKYIGFKTEEEIDQNLKDASEAKNKLDKAVADYETSTDKTKALETLKSVQEDYNKLYSAKAYAYKEVESIENAFTVISGKDGRFVISGLKEGTYKLEEIEAPKGYAKNTSDYEFKVGKGTWNSSDGIDYVKNSTKKDAQNIENTKISIPQTGGIGTVIFTVAGLIIMGAAIYALKKNNQEVDA